MDTCITGIRVFRCLRALIFSLVLLHRVFCFEGIDCWQLVGNVFVLHINTVILLFLL